MSRHKKNRATYALTKVARSYNPAIDYMIILPVQGPGLRVLPVLRGLLRVLRAVLPALQALQQRELLLLLLSCSRLPRLIKKPTKAR